MNGLTRLTFIHFLRKTWAKTYVSWKTSKWLSRICGTVFGIIWYHLWYKKLHIIGIESQIMQINWKKDFGNINLNNYGFLHFVPFSPNFFYRNKKHLCKEPRPGISSSWVTNNEFNVGTEIAFYNEDTNIIRYMFLCLSLHFKSHF